MKAIKSLSLLLFGLIMTSTAMARPWSPGVVTLFASRVANGAHYSFRHLTSSDAQATNNNWDLVFEANDNDFRVQTAMDDFSFIFDLGEKSCKDIRAAYPQDRGSRPLGWLASSDADPSEMTPKSTAPVIKGHCYLVYGSDNDGRVIALFHVKDHMKSVSVTLDEIEVLDLITKR